MTAKGKAIKKRKTIAHKTFRSDTLQTIARGVDAQMNTNTI